MKKIILSLAAVILSAGFVFAQDMATATETAKTANDALSIKDYASALAGFQQALTEAAACGEEGEELVNTCKGVIPTIMLNIAKNAIKESKFDDGLKTLADAIKTAGEYGADDVVAEATTLVGQAKKAKASSLVKAKDYVNAIAAYKEVLEADPADGASALQLGAALNATGDTAGAVAAFEQAMANGQEATAKKQLANIYLKDGQALLKEKKFKEAVEACLKSAEYNPSANAYKLAASAATQNKDNANAIAYYEKYLEVSPDAKDAPAITFTIAALYQQAGNKAKALENYKKVASDPTYGPQAKPQIDALSK